MSYIIATDSSSNIPREIVKKLEIPVLPFHYTMDGEEYRETLLEEEVQRRAFFAAMRINVEVKTSLINFNEFEEFFEPFPSFRNGSKNSSMNSKNFSNHF